MIEGPPVEEGEIIRAECISTGNKGDGVFKIEGFIVMVPGTREGREYDIEITRVLDNVGFGKVVR